MPFDAIEEEAIDVVLREGCVTPQLVKTALEEDLLPLLPLLLASPHANDLLNLLQDRLCASRHLKLRYMLLRGHQAFQSIPCKRRFTSAAYGHTACANQLQKKLSRRKCAPPDNQSPDTNCIRILVDMVDLQSEDFFRNEIYNHISRKDESFGHTLISHPFLLSEEVELTSLADSRTVSESGQSSMMANFQYMVQCAHLHVAQGQAVLGLRRICPVANLLDKNHTEPVYPEMLVRSGEDSLRYVAVQLLLRVFNAAWARPSRQFPDAASAPYCRVVDSAVVGETRWLEVALEKTTQLTSFTFDYWRYTRALDPVLADSFVRSAAGLFTAGYVIGVGRHPQEIGVTESREMYFRDLRGAFEYAPPMARMTVPKDMKDAFAALGLLDTFRDTCLRAFAVLRDNHKEIFSIVFDVFKLSGLSNEKILQFVAGKNSLNLAEDRMLANTHFRKWIG